MDPSSRDYYLHISEKAWAEMPRPHFEAFRELDRELRRLTMARQMIEREGKERVMHACPECKYRGPSEADLAKHRRFFHGVVAEGTGGTVPGCEYCPLTTSQNATARRLVAEALGA